MKKKFLYIFSLGVALSALSVSSCNEDKLRLLPEIGSPVEEAIKNESDMKVVLNGVYTRMSSSSGFGAAVSIFGDLLSDNTFVSNVNSGYFLNTSRMSYSAEISDFSMMDSFYDVIQQANMVISNESVPVTTNVRHYKAEAKIARAMAYFYLLSFYSPDPKSGVNQEYGVPIIPELYNPNDKLGRSSVAEGYNYVISDLESAITQLADASAPAKKSLLSVNAAKLLLSRIYLTRGANGDYQKSIDYANQLINIAPTGTEAFTMSTYQSYFAGNNSGVMDNQPETIFEIEQTNLFNVGGNAHPASFYANNGNHKSLLYRQSFVSIFQNNDWRKGLVGAQGPIQDTPRGNFARKWVRLTNDEGNYASNIKLMRFSEAYLNKAEALFKMGDKAAALATLNDFKQKRAANPISTISLQEILDERRREFFAEGYRYFDLKRNGLPIIKESNCTDHCNVPATDRLFVLPIPYSEMNINPNITQYPGW